VFSFETPAHARLLAARDQAFAQFVEHFKAAVVAVEGTCAELLQHEKAWEATWAGMVKSLVASTQDIG
jgi:hypothetical protein